MKRLGYGWILLIGFGLLVQTAKADTHAFFTSQDNIEEKLAQLIDESHVTIDMALFRFSSQPLALAINNARKRGVKVRLILDGHKEAEDGLNNLKASFADGEVRRLDGKSGRAQGIMHNKFVLFDSAKLVTGSFNWTKSAEHANYENALLTDDAQTVTQYRQEFQKLWDKTEAVPTGQFQEGPAPQNSPHRSKRTFLSSKMKSAMYVIMRRRRSHTKRR